MRWLIIQSDGEHKGQDGWTRNDYLRECHALKYALEKNSQKVLIWGKRHKNYNRIPNFNNFDVIFIAENYDFKWIPEISKTKSLKIQWIIDLHCNKPKHYFTITKQADVIAHSTKKLIPSYQSLFPNKKHIWFPNGVDEYYFNSSLYNYKIDIDLAFIGSLNPARKKMINKLQKQLNMYVAFKTGIDMIKMISKTKIHFNKSIGCDINYRNFETIGLGTCLLTNYDKELIELGFKDGENCLIYHDINDAIEKTNKALKDKSWKTIGNKAYQLSKKHTYTQRINNLIKELNL